MSIETVKTVVERFIRQNQWEVMALKGAWGVGKTYAWQQLIKTLSGSIWPPAYSYVSLFGITSLADLRIAILANRQTGAAISGTSPTSPVAWRDQLRGLRNAANDLKVGKAVSIGLDALTPSLMRNMLICFDDLERLSGVSHDALMGFISTLKERSNCKVAIILNDQELPENEDGYQKYREKVVDIELTFAPTAAEVIDWGLRPDLPYRHIVRPCVLALEIKNVRIVQKICRVIDLLSPILASLHEAVATETVNSVVLIGWSYWDKSGRAPPLNFLRTWNWALSRVSEKDKNTPTPDEIRWRELLNTYPFRFYDEFDAAVLKTIEQGYAEESGFPEEAKKRDELARSGDLEAGFAAAWKLFRDSFADNEAQIISDMDASCRRAARLISPVNLNGTVVLMRELGHGELADALIEHYVKTRQSESALFDLDDHPFGREVTDPTIRKAFAAQSALISKKISLRRAVETIATNSWSPEDTAALSAASIDELYQLFKGPLSISRNRAVEICLRFNEPPTQHIAERAAEALKRIGGESRLNAVRVRRFGITVTTTPP